MTLRLSMAMDCVTVGSIPNGLAGRHPSVSWTRWRIFPQSMVSYCYPRELGHDAARGGDAMFVH